MYNFFTKPIESDGKLWYYTISDINLAGNASPGRITAGTAEFKNGDERMDKMCIRDRTYPVVGCIACVYHKNHLAVNFFIILCCF